MLKSYEELRKINVRPFCKERDCIPYLPYNKCIDLLRENGAEEAHFVPVDNPKTHSSVFETETVFADKNGITNRCYETKIEIHIDGKLYPMKSPIMNGANPVRDNSMSQQRVWNSMARSFVKGVAMYTGLGFDLWLEGEEAEQKQQAAADQHHDIMKVKEQVLQTLTAIQKEGNMTRSDIASRMSRSEEELVSYINQYDILLAVENNLMYILKQIRQEVPNDRR